MVLNMSNITNHHLSKSIFYLVTNRMAQYICNLYTFTQILLVQGKKQNKTKE